MIYNHSMPKTLSILLCDKKFFNFNKNLLFLLFILIIICYTNLCNTNNSRRNHVRNFIKRKKYASMDR